MHQTSPRKTLSGGKTIPTCYGCTKQTPRKTLSGGKTIQPRSGLKTPAAPMPCRCPLLLLFVSLLFSPLALVSLLGLRHLALHARAGLGFCLAMPRSALFLCTSTSPSSLVAPTSRTAAKLEARIEVDRRGNAFSGLHEVQDGE